MMTAAQQYGVGELGISAIRPVHNVVGVREAEPTPWEAAAAVSGIERSARGRGDRAGLPTHVEH